MVNYTHEPGEIKPLMKQRFPKHPKEFPYTRKCILAFMDIDDAPVCFFAMVVFEYGDDCPPPNTRRVYISLLDSVKLPKSYLPSASRTAIYHGLVRGYLRNCGERGFEACHIYTCPPRKGQNYVFPHKPEDQKEISLVRLRRWYGPSLCCRLLFSSFPAALTLSDETRVSAEGHLLAVGETVLV